MKAIITIGVSSSGKTTWAKEQKGFRIVCRDDIRRDILEDKGLLFSDQNLWSKWKFSKTNEQEVTDIYWTRVDSLADNGRNIILADTNLNPGRRQEMKTRLESLGYGVEFKQFDCDYETAVKRDLNRRDSVGGAVIWKQYKELYGEVYVPPSDAPKAVIFDIDGTLAYMTNRGPFEWDKVDQDSVDIVVKSILYWNYECGTKVIILSGRDSVCRNLTENWLTSYRIHYDELHMRAEGDMRKDAIVKRELFDKHIRDKYNVVAVFDDRPVCVRLWNLLGLKTFCVSDPYIEF